MRNALLLALLGATAVARGDENADVKKIVDRAVQAAGGAEKLPQIVRWKERYYLGDSKTGHERSAVIRFPDAWFQDGKNIARDNPDRTEKAYLAGMWTLRPLIDAQTRLQLIPAVEVDQRPADGLRVTRDELKDKHVDLYFDQETGRLARIDWRAYHIFFSDWQEAEGYHYPCQAFVRREDGTLSVRTEFLEFQPLKELPAGLTP